MISRWLVVAFLLFTSPALAQLGTIRFSGASTLPTAITTLLIGAGGQVTGIDIAPDGTKVVKTDVGGAYYCPAPCTSPGGWLQVLSASSMPSGDSNVGWSVLIGPAASGYSGPYEIRLAYSSTSIFYVYYANAVYKGTYSGGKITLAKTNHTFPNAPGNDSTLKFRNSYMAVDPNDPNTVITGGPTSDPNYTTDGGATWHSISGLCTPTLAYFFSIDPANSSNVSIGCYGTGMYRSTTGVSGAFTLTSSGPATFNNLITTTVDGSVCALDNVTSSGVMNLWAFYSGTWHHVTLTTASELGISVSYNSSHTYVMGLFGDIFWVSNSAAHCGDGATWTTPSFTATMNQTSPDIGWISADYNYSAIGLNPANIMVDPNSNRLYQAMGVGVAYMAAPSVSTGAVWIDQSAGIEELVTNKIISCNGGYGPLASVWDRQIFNLAGSASASPTYPASHGTITPANNNQQIIGSWDADCSWTNPGFVAAISNWFFGPIDKSGYSTNGGSSWTVFSAFPGDSTTTIGGSMAVGDDQTIVWATGNFGGNGGHLWYTTNRGGAWTQLTSANCPNLPTSGGWVAANGYSFARFVVAADKSLTNTFYLYNNNLAGSTASFYKLTFSAGVPTCVQTRTSALDTLGTDGANDLGNVQMKAVPGQAQNLFYTSGTQSPLVGTQKFWRSTDGGVTWSQVSGVFSVNSFGFGAAKPGGGGYPAIFVQGMVNGSTKMGIWRSDDNASTWVGPLSPCPANITAYDSCPANSIDIARDLNGDLNRYGIVYVSFTGTGAAWGTN